MPFQSAYRQNYSTDRALLRIVHGIFTSYDNGKVAFLTLLDLSAALDTKDRSVLIVRLHKSFCIQDKVLPGLNPNSRKNLDSIKWCKYSNKPPLRYGVSRGSVLGPLLYALHTLPFGKMIKSTLCKLSYYVRWRHPT